MAAAGTRLNRILTLSLVSPGLHYQGSESTQKKQEYGVKVEVRHSTHFFSVYPLFEIEVLG